MTREAAQALVNLRALCAALPDSARFGQHRSRFTEQIEVGLKALGWVPVQAPTTGPAMTVDEAVRRLGELFSEDDPIRYKRQDTTPSRLRDICDETHAAAVRIFYGAKAERRGSLLDMVRDRQAARDRGDIG